MALRPGQQKCVDTLDRSIVVAAGAGSGKTFTLTKRVVNAITTGAVDGIERVCAITFTNKAAGELKSRIKSELRTAGFLEQALKVDEAWVSTIHGLCGRILKAHALELDLDPAFTMIDPADATLLRDGAIDAVLLAAETAPDEGGWRQAVDALFAEYPARSFGARGTSVESMIKAIMDKASSAQGSFDAFKACPSAVNPASLAYAVLDCFEELAGEALAQKPNEAREAWAAAVSDRIARVRADIEAGHAGAASWALRALDGLPAPKKVGTAAYKQRVEEAVELYRMCVMELRLAVASAHLDTLVELARQANACYAEAKRAQGVLDNDDLLACASRAIGEHPAIAQLYTDKFQLIMVDEFQDTDQMQLDMIKRLAGPGARRLCTVGDAQQSIYRFRGADVGVYRRHLAQVSANAPDDVIELPDNFRSHRDVLALVDCVFGRPDMFGGSFMSLKPERDESLVGDPLVPGVPRVQVQLTTNAYRGASAAQVRQVAAARIARSFAELHELGHSAGQMAVLLGGMTHASVYAEALRREGLACVIAGGSVFSEAPEVALVVDLVRTASNPYRTQPLRNVLAGPLFGLCADDMLQLATVHDQGGVARHRNLCTGLMALVAQPRDGQESPELPPQLALAVRVMGDFIGGVARSSLSRLIRRVLVESGWISRQQGLGAEGLASVANAYKAVRMIEGLEAQHVTGPARLASQFEELLGQAKEAPGALSASGGDFVRIMTVHASKGLEFPIVAVAEFKEPRGDASKLIAGSVDGRVYLSLDAGNSAAKLEGAAKLRDVGSLYGTLMQERCDEDELARAVVDCEGALSLRAALYELDRRGEEEEAKRLLYVALTRAKEALVISLAGKRSKDNPNGTPKSCLGAVVRALAGDEGFGEGVTMADYGGTMPARVEHVALADDGSAEVLPDDPAAPDAPDQGQPACFMVPKPTNSPSVRRGPYSSAHEGVFSYSSIADAAHEGEVLEQLADRFFAGADPCASQQQNALFLQPAEDEGGDFDFAFSWQEANRNAAVADEDDGSWAYGGVSCADSDKATDLGTAFHRLAQHAVCVRQGALRMPDVARIDALARACRLDDVQRDRLDQALKRWFSSDVAARAASCENLAAEVPFFVSLTDGDGACAGFMEGEIDLLGMDASATRALVVDYKTGGRDDETVEDLRVKHVLQASCYAYAVMLQGISEVEACFVRVERPRADVPDAPQCVRYRFAASDLPALREAIASVYARTR